jgi:hypothetical protein
MGLHAPCDYIALKGFDVFSPTAPSIRLIVIALALAGSAACTTSSSNGLPARFPRLDDANELRRSSQAIVDSYVKEAAAAGVEPAYTPSVVIETTPGLIFFTRDKRTITVPRWPDVPEEARAIFREFTAGDGEKAELLFRSLFNWFFIAHEASHWLREEHGGDVDHYASEVEANDLAAAFWARDGTNAQRLATLESLLSEIVTRVPDPTPAGTSPREYFNTHYDELGQDPMKYGYYQFRFVLDSLRRRSELRFGEQVRRAVPR